MKTKTYYIVGGVEKSHPVGFGEGVVSSVEFKEMSLTWADGMIGVCPVFTNLRKAKKYADGLAIYTVQGVEK